MKTALCIGINQYSDPSASLNGCVNDAGDYADYFCRLGYTSDLLVDQNATKGAIVAAMASSLQRLMPEETGVIVFSGHGTWEPDRGSDESDKRDEAICPCDLGDWNHLLMDDEIASILKARTVDSRVLFISDSCHSGTVMSVGSDPNRRARFLPPEKIGGGKMAVTKRRYNNKPRFALPGVCFISGCKDDETSDETRFGDRTRGVLTHHLLYAMYMVGSRWTPKALYQELRAALPGKEFSQTPQLVCDPALVNVPLLT